MSTPPKKVDSPQCRTDLVRKAAREGDSFRSAFDWINDKQARIAEDNPGNRGLRATEIRQLAENWILDGNQIDCVPEGRNGYKERRHFHYDIIIGNLPDFPRGLYVEMELSNADPDVPSVSLLSAHPPSFY